MYAFCLFNQINNAFLFSGDRIPRTFSVRSLKFTFLLVACKDIIKVSQKRISFKAVASR